MTPAQFEAAVLGPVVLGGCLAAWRLGLRRWAVVALGPPVGLSLYLAFGFFAVAIPGRLPVQAVVALTLVAPLLAAAPALLRSKESIAQILWIAAPAVVVALLGLSTYPVADRLTDVNHGDTVHHLNIASLIHSNSLAEFVSAHFLPKRQIGVGLLHAPASLIGEYHLRLAQPLIALCLLIVMAWLIADRLKNQIARPHLALAIIAMLLAFVTIPRFATHAFYINGHVFAGLYFLIIAGVGWLTAGRSRPDAAALFTVQALGVVSLVMLRPEGGILAGIALAPTLLADTVSARIRIALCLTLGVSMAAWNGYVLAVIFAQGEAAPASAVALLSLGCLTAIAAPLLSLPALALRRRALIASFEVGLWLALMILAARNPDMLADSLEATLKNLDRFWGNYPLIVLGLGLAGYAVAKTPDSVFIRLPVTSYVPLVFLLAYLREGAYRTSGADSLNRMLITILPLAVVWIASMAGAKRLRRPFGAGRRAAGAWLAPLVRAPKAARPLNASGAPSRASSPAPSGAACGDRQFGSG